MCGPRVNQEDLMRSYLVLALIMLSSCASYTHHLSKSDDFLVLLVDAPGFDTTNAQTLLKSMAKHPRTWNKDSSVGHAWIFIHGRSPEGCFYVEGGHSGELGICQPRYVEGVMCNFEEGDPNPISYLWCAQQDGFFQKGAGGHRPTFAIKINITNKQREAILEYIRADHYNYSHYSITANQCCTYAVQAAQIAGLSLEHEVSVEIPEQIKLGKSRCRLWEDPEYSQLCFSSPDRLEASMRRAVKEGYAEDALAWYLRYREKKRCLKCKIKFVWQTILRFPSRYSLAKLVGRF